MTGVQTCALPIWNDIQAIKTSSDQKLLIRKFYDNSVIQIENLLDNEGTTNNIELNNLCKKLIGKNFLGVFPADDFIEPYKNGQSCILNIQNSTNKGEHWVALYNECNCVYFFDTYNRNYKELNIHFKHMKWISPKHEKLQSLRSRNCGQECISFIICSMKFGCINFFNTFVLN